MRAARKQNLLAEDHVRELDKIGFVWSVDRQLAWEKRFRELEAFTRKHRRRNVPVNFPANPALGRWASLMRQKKKRGTLAKERIRRLSALGFCWNMSKGAKPLRKPNRPKAKLRKRPA